MYNIHVMGNVCVILINMMFIIHNIYLCCSTSRNTSDCISCPQAVALPIRECHYTVSFILDLFPERCSKKKVTKIELRILVNNIKTHKFMRIVYYAILFSSNNFIKTFH